MEWEAGMVFATSACARLSLPNLEAEDAEEGLREDGDSF